MEKRTSECDALPFPGTKESSTSSRTLPTARHSMGERGRSASSTQDRTLRAVDPRCYRSRSVASKGEGHSIQNLAPSGFSKPHFNFKQRTTSLEGPATGHSSVGWSANRYFSPSLVEMHFFQQLDKPRIGAKRVEDPIDFEKGQPRRANLIGLLQSVQCPPLVAETEVYHRGAER